MGCGLVWPTGPPFDFLEYQALDRGWKEGGRGKTRVYVIVLLINLRKTTANAYYVCSLATAHLSL